VVTAVCGIGAYLGYKLLSNKTNSDTESVNSNTEILSHLQQNAISTTEIVGHIQEDIAKLNESMNQFSIIEKKLNLLS